MKRLAKKLLALILVIGLAFPISGVSVQAEETVEKTVTVKASFVGQYKIGFKAELDAEHPFLGWGNQRTVLAEFDISDIVKNATINSATLYTTVHETSIYRKSNYGIYFYDGVLEDRYGKEDQIRQPIADAIATTDVVEDVEKLKLDANDASFYTVTDDNINYNYNWSCPIDVSGVIEGGDCLGLHKDGKFTICFYAPYGGVARSSEYTDISIILNVTESASGDDNTGDDNTGDDNTGDDNTGDDNTGDDNTGDDNTGDDNTGDDNTGDDNTGDDNTGDEPTTSWTIEGNTVNVQRGQKATVVFDVKESTLANVRAARIQVAYDDAVLSISDESAVVLGNMLKANGNATADVNINYSEAGDSCISVACVSTEDVLSGTGTLLSITFDVKENAAIGESSVSLTVVELLGDDTDAISTTTNVVEGKVTVAPPVEFTPGDVDNNGAVELEDALTSLKIAVGSLSVEAGSVGFWAADMDGNGSITVEDVLQILKMANGKTV